MRADSKINAYYLRLSLEDGDVADGNSAESCSITSQRMCIRQYLSEHPELGSGFREFSDDGYSGTSMDRPGIQQLLKLVCRGDVKTIVVRDLSRFARNYLEAGHYLEFVFPAYGVRFISLNDHYDSAEYGENPAGLEMVIRNLLNEMYSRDISRKIKSAMDLKKQSGQFVYGNAPYGYRKGKVKNTVEPDTEAAPVVREIFRMACQGTSVTEIARTLNREKVPTPSAHLTKYRSKKYPVYRDWTWDSVRHILRNRFYTGDTEPYKSHVIRVGSSQVRAIPPEFRDIIPGTHVPLVSRDDYWKAQSAIRTVAPRKGTSRNNPLTSKLVCGVCGNRLQKGRTQSLRWICIKARYNPDLACKDVQTSEDKIRDILLRAIRQQALLAQGILREQELAQMEAQAKKEPLEAQLPELERSLEILDQSRIALLDAVLDETLSREVYLEKKKINLAQAQGIRDRISQIREELDALPTAEQTPLIREAEAVSHYQDLAELTPEAIELLVRKVVVYPRNRVKIFWNFPEFASNFLS